MPLARVSIGGAAVAPARDAFRGRDGLLVQQPLRGRGLPLVDGNAGSGQPKRGDTPCLRMSVILHTPMPALLSAMSEAGADTPYWRGAEVRPAPLAPAESADFAWDQKLCVSLGCLGFPSTTYAEPVHRDSLPRCCVSSNPTTRQRSATR